MMREPVKTLLPKFRKTKVDEWFRSMFPKHNHYFTRLCLVMQSLQIAQWASMNAECRTHWGHFVQANSPCIMVAQECSIRADLSGTGLHRG